MQFGGKSINNIARVYGACPLLFTIIRNYITMLPAKNPTFGYFMKGCRYCSWQCPQEINEVSFVQHHYLDRSIRISLNSKPLFNLFEREGVGYENISVNTAICDEL